MRRNAEPREFVQALAGLDFPASTSAVRRKAHDHGGIDSEVLAVFERLPDRTFDTPADLRACVDEIYADLAQDLEHAEPAAPTPLDMSDKELVSDAADTRTHVPGGDAA